MIDTEWIQQMSFWIAALTVIGGLIGVVALIGGNILTLLNLGGGDSAEKLLAKDTLSRGDKDKVLRTVRSRKATIVFLTLIIVLVACLGFVIYRKLVPPQQGIEPGFGFVSAEPVQPTQDKWLEDNSLFQALVTELMPEAAKEGNVDESTPDKTSAESKVIRLTTPPFGSVTDGRPTLEAVCTVQYPPHDYDFRPPHVIVVRHLEGRQCFDPLRVQSTDGSFSFTIPNAGSKDYLLVIGALERKGGGKLPDELQNLFSFKVTK